MQITYLRANLGKQLIVLFTLLLLATSCQTEKKDQGSAQASPSLSPITLTAGKIVAGIGIEEVKLGQTRAEVEPSLGPPTSQDVNEYVPGQTYLLYHDKGIELTLQDDKVEMITLHAPVQDWSAYSGATADGLGVTSSAQEISEKLGRAENEAPQALKYQALGIWFRFDQARVGDGSNARATSVSLVSPGTEG